MAEFSAGQIVCLKSDKSKKGAVLSFDEATERVQIFLDGKARDFFASQLVLAAETKAENRFSNYTDFHTFLTALQVREPDNSSLFSLNSGKIDFIPYQYRPVLKFIKADEPRILIADSVGVGKTIESELILKELEARKNVERVLIICPKPLVTERKWESEMRRFGEEFTALDSNKLRYCIEETDFTGVWPVRFGRCIIPYSLFDSDLIYGKKRAGKTVQKGLLDLNPAPRFDLVIVDEAHHIKNAGTSRYEAANFFSQNADAAVFLTATPIELGNKDLFVLLNSLRPDLFLDLVSFEEMTEPNEFINNAAVAVREKRSNWKKDANNFLEQASQTEWGKNTLLKNPDFASAVNCLAKKNISDEERVKLITSIEQLNTFSNIINRTRRRDIGDFTLRKTETLRCTFSDDQKQFYEHLLRVEKIVMQTIHGDNVAMMMNMIERQAASCIHGMVPLLESIMSRNIVSIIEDSEITSERALNSTIEKLKAHFSELKKEAAAISEDDAKYESLVNALEEKQKLKNNKVIIFSTFRHTLNYLETNLKRDGFRIAVVHGDVPDEMRREYRKRFMLSKKHADAIDVMLFSDVGCEGLDYQFCDYMVNYDLPWNPMKVEQRIGRIDRNGQKSESVVIVNMITEETVEQEIYDRCLSRIGVFEKSLGDCEDILGDITQEIQSVAMSFKLTPEQKKLKLQQIADNQIRFNQEKEKLEDEQYNLFGIKINALQTRKEIEEATNDWHSGAELKTLVGSYLETLGAQAACDASRMKLRLSRDVKDRLLKDFSELKLPRINANYIWEKWLKSNEQNLQLMFVAEESATAANDDALLINVLHPLVMQAAKSIDIEYPRFVYIDLREENVGQNGELDFADSGNSNDNIQIEKGEHKFVIYQWTYEGSYTDRKLFVAAENENVQKEITKNLSRYKNFEVRAVEDESAWSSLSNIHKKKWLAAKKEFVEKNKQITEFKKQSISASYNAQRLMLKAQIEQITDEKILKMRQTQLARAKEKYESRLSALDGSLEKVDITFRPVVLGVIVN